MAIFAWVLWWIVCVLALITCFHLTFDDGFREMHDIVAPILHRAGVPATFFLTTAFLDGGGLAHHNALSVLLDRLEPDRGDVSPANMRRFEALLPEATHELSTVKARILSIPYAQNSVVSAMAEALSVDLGRYVHETQPYLSSEQITTMIKLGFNIGAHSHDHPLYSAIPLPEQILQTRTSINVLEKRFGVSPKAFAFPHTDNGVGETFFSYVFAEHLLDVSFGTAGMAPHFCPRNIERVSMERKSVPAAQILARQFARATYFRVRP